MTKICSISGCCRRHEAKGYCKAHYHRLSRHGDPLGGGTPHGEQMRFIREVALRHTGDECLLWPYSKSRKGYGNFWLDGKNTGAHRYVCTLAKGPPPTPEHEASHSCGKGHEGCISPIHLDWKTTAQNQADRLVHGTHSRGERNPRAKLTEADVLEIIALKGRESQRKIAARFGVHIGHVGHIHTGRKWAWLNEPQERELS